MVVIVHPHVDADAVVSATLAGAHPRDVHFVPAGYTAVPERCPCCGVAFTGEERILDHPLGMKGELDADGTVHSAVASMPEAAALDPRLLEEVEQGDSTGIRGAPRFHFGDILAAVRVDAKMRGFFGHDQDREVLAVVGRIVRGLTRLHQGNLDADKVALECRVEGVDSFRVALIPERRSYAALSNVLREKHGVLVQIYADGFNLGVHRIPDPENPGNQTPDLRRLEPHLPGWFVHSAGFLASWGTKKSPKRERPPAGTPQTPDELLALMRTVYGEAH